MGTLWEGWTYGGGGASFLHTMFGGGVGLWFYEVALGVRTRVVRRGSRSDSVGASASAAAGSGGGAAAAEEAEASFVCAARLRGLTATALYDHLGASERVVCAAARVRDALPGSGNLHALRREARRQLRLGGADEAASSSPSFFLPTARVVLDAAVVRGLGAAEGRVETPAGMVEVSWRWSGGGGGGGNAAAPSASPALALHVSFPSSGIEGSAASAFVPASLLRDVRGPGRCSMTASGGLLGELRSVGLREALSAEKGILPAGFSVASAAEAQEHAFAAGDEEWVRVALGPGQWSVAVGCEA